MYLRNWAYTVNKVHFSVPYICSITLHPLRYERLPAYVDEFNLLLYNVEPHNNTHGHFLTLLNDDTSRRTLNNDMEVQH